MNIDKTWQQLGKTFGGGYGNVIAMYRLINLYLATPPTSHRTAHEFRRNDL